MNLPYWARGGIIGVVLVLLEFIIPVVAYFLPTNLLFLPLFFLGDFLRTLSGPMYSAFYSAWIIIISGILGFFYGLLKQKNDKLLFIIIILIGALFLVIVGREFMHPDSFGTGAGVLGLMGIGLFCLIKGTVGLINYYKNQKQSTNY